MRWYGGNISKILNMYVAFNQDAISSLDIEGLNIVNNITTTHNDTKATEINHNQRQA